MTTGEMRLAPVTNVNVNAVPTTVTSPIAQKAEPKIQSKGEFMVPPEMQDILMPNTPKPAQQPKQIFAEPPIQKPIEDAIIFERNMAPQMPAPVQDARTIMTQLPYDGFNMPENVVGCPKAIPQYNYQAMKNFAIYENINNYVAQQQINNAINNQFARNMFARNMIVQNAIQDAIYADMTAKMMENIMLSNLCAPMHRPYMRPRRCCCPRCARHYFNPYKQIRRNILQMQMMAMYTYFMTMMGFMFGRMMAEEMCY